MTAPEREADLKRKTAALIGEINEAEMACRIVEAANGLQRPEGLSAVQALDSLDPESRTWALRMARAALTYVSECLASARRPS